MQPSLLLHPLDFLSGEDITELKFFPGMNIGTGEKLELMDGFLAAYTKSFDVMNMYEHVRQVRNAAGPNAEHSPVLS